MYMYIKPFTHPPHPYIHTHTHTHTHTQIPTHNIHTCQLPKLPFSMPSTLSIPVYTCRWKIVIHGAIDGYSRMIVYMRCSSNNRSATVLDLFVEAVRVFGCPSRARGDRGGENTQVADFMIVQRGPGRASFICGRSVHNQRIERLWRDVFASCTVLL